MYREQTQLRSCAEVDKVWDIRIIKSKTLEFLADSRNANHAIQSQRKTQAAYQATLTTQTQSQQSSKTCDSRAIKMGTMFSFPQGLFMLSMIFKNVDANGRIVSEHGPKLKDV
eukprot:TRINITY_DN5441_c0_g1_i3.p1 TRINITY_DN5441_c0_g1~~TRINITY_DN5441_c0_g1_i3.p1  ORF type:complete len:113 (-),score=10.09 TRINITY_DN5441_c0_g1_i3:347-685(-)